MNKYETQKAERAMNALLAIILRLKLTKDETNILGIRQFLYSVGRVSVYEIIALETSILRSHRIPFKRIAQTINESLKELQK